METQIVIKEWSVEDRQGKGVITGKYAVKLGEKEIAEQSFNSAYGGAKIEFEREVQDAVVEVTKKINDSIQRSFTN